MSFAAILSASKLSADPGGALRANLHFAGQTLVEYQARQASRAGASAILILVSAVTPQLSQAIDRLSADGIAVTLIRDMVTLVRDAPRDRDMLLVADGAVVGQAHYDALGQSGGQSGGQASRQADSNILLVADDSRASAPFERIDAGQRWAGLARVTPDLLFGTLDMIGDWDLELTLVRAAVQAGARRITVSQDELMEGRVTLVEGQPQADLAAHAVISGSAGGVAVEGGVEHYALSRAAKGLAPMLMRSQVPAIQTRIAGIALAAIGLVPIQLGWLATGLLLLLLSLVLHLAADRLEEMALRRRASGLTAFAVPALVLVGIGLVDGGFSALYLLALLGIVTVAIRWRLVGQVRPWMLFTPGSAVLLLLLATAVDSLLEGLMLAMFATIGSIGAIVLGRSGRPKE